MVLVPKVLISKVVFIGSQETVFLKQSFLGLSWILDQNTSICQCCVTSDITIGRTIQLSALQQIVCWASWSLALCRAAPSALAQDPWRILTSTFGSSSLHRLFSST